MKALLHIGDRVEHTRKGKGRAIAVNKSFNTILIEYDDWDGGHNGSDADRPISPKHNHCWFHDKRDVHIKVIYENPIISELLKVVGR